DVSQSIVKVTAGQRAGGFLFVRFYWGCECRASARATGLGRILRHCSKTRQPNGADAIQRGK
ncbi:hypothetical protein EFL64_11605, partial [Weissella cibaria]|nr:hypothetical protein [Weissella cibaria]